MKLSRRQFLHQTAGAVTISAIPGKPAAQSYPSRPIRAIVTAGAGSAVDVLPRVIFDKLSSQLGEPIVVENRVGAGGTIAIAAVAKAEPDGYTILANSSAHSVLPWLYMNLPYDTTRDLAGIIPLGSMPLVLVTSPAKGHRTIGDFVAAAKAKPGSFNFTSTGIGTATHMSAERFRASAGIEAVHVPVKSGPEALTEVISGRADFYFCPIGTALPFIRDGKLAGLVVNSGERALQLPDVPTTAQAGLANADYRFWIGLFAPARTPRNIIDRLYRETASALQTAGVSEKLNALGVTAMDMTPAQFDDYVRDEIAANGALIKAANIESH